MEDQAYQRRLRQELDAHDTRVEVHDLPPIYHYWSGRYLAPKLSAIGWDSIESLYVSPAVEACRRNADRTVRAISLGSGNGETEVNLLHKVRMAGCQNLEVTCGEVNHEMQERARRQAESVGVADGMRHLEVDLNTWTADGTYDVVLASHSLHHVLDLEHLFGEVRRALGASGVFVVNDMIGRNGHMRWPEAEHIVRGIWRSMPDRYRYNHQLRLHDEVFVNRDCSTEGFEGIRAQDILPLLLDRFSPRTFLAFANVIDVFVDRGYGPNFSVDRAADRLFIDRLAQLDELTIDLGVVKPTHLLATFGTEPATASFHAHWSPEFCLRDPAETDLAGAGGGMSSADEQLTAILDSRAWRYVQRLRRVRDGVRSTTRRLVSR